MNLASLYAIASRLRATVRALRPRSFRLLHRIAGIDRRVLARCSKAEQATYTALATTMVLAAAATGLGVALKLQPLLAAGWMLTLLVALVAATFALSLEMAVVGSIKAGTNAVWALAMRVPLALMLCVIQVIPIWLALFSGPIAVMTYQHQLVTQIELRTTSAKAVDFDAVRQESADLAKALETAKQNQNHPVPSAAVLQAEDALKKSEQVLGQDMAKLNAGKQQLAQAKDGMARAVDDKARNLAAQKVEARTAALARAQVALNAAAAARDNAESTLTEAQGAQRRALAEGVTAAEKAATAHSAVEKSTSDAMATNMAKAKELSEADNSGNFMAQLTMLLALWQSDHKILALSMVILALALLIDLLPTGIKLSLKRGPYASTVAALEKRALERTMAETEVELLNIQNQLAQEKNIAAGIAQYFAVDNGALEAQRVAVEQQAELDKAKLLAPFVLTTAAFEQGICHVLAAAGKAEDLVNAHPQLKPVFAEQLRQLLARVEAQARDLATPAPAAKAA